MDKFILPAHLSSKDKFVPYHKSSKDTVIIPSHKYLKDKFIPSHSVMQRKTYSSTGSYFFSKSKNPS